MEISREQFLLALYKYFQREWNKHRGDEYGRFCETVELNLHHLSSVQSKGVMKDEKVHIGKLFGVFGFGIE